VKPGRTVFDRYGMWAVVAVALVIIAYAYPIWAHLHMERFGAPGVRQY
jgi:nitrate reductase NapE component